MSDKATDVMIAGYLTKEPALLDYQALVDSGAKIDGAVCITRDLEGNTTVEQTDHLVKGGAKALGGAGLVVGLFAPPRLAAPAVGAAGGGLAGKVARPRARAGIGDKLDDALPPGTAGIIAIYDHAHAALVDETLANAIRKSVAQIDKASANELKDGLQQASAGLAG